MTPVSDATADLASFLESTRSTDGAWGVMPGREPDVESTAWVLYASASVQELSAYRDPARQWLLGQQRANGSWTFRAGPEFNTWPTFTAVVALAAAKTGEPERARALQWILAQHTVRPLSWWDRMRASFATRTASADAEEPILVLDATLDGFGWADDTSTWVEPTVLAMLALATSKNLDGARERLTIGAGVLLDRQAPDGGWNYGNTRVLGYDLPGYPDTTGWAILGLVLASELGIVDSFRARTAVVRGLKALPSIEQPGIAPLPMALELLARRSCAVAGITIDEAVAGRTDADVRTQLFGALRSALEDSAAGYPTIDTRTAVLSLLAVRDQHIVAASA